VAQSDGGGRRGRRPRFRRRRRQARPTALLLHVKGGTAPAGAGCGQCVAWRPHRWGRERSRGGGRRGDAESRQKGRRRAEVEARGGDTESRPEGRCRIEVEAGGGDAESRRRGRDGQRGSAQGHTSVAAAGWGEWEVMGFEWFIYYGSLWALSRPECRILTGCYRASPLTVSCPCRHYGPNSWPRHCQYVVSYLTLALSSSCRVVSGLCSCQMAIYTRD
jgi:hypothetical protein